VALHKPAKPRDCNHEAEFFWGLGGHQTQPLTAGRGERSSTLQSLRPERFELCPKVLNDKDFSKE
jgi:hypothetical protein